MKTEWLRKFLIAGIALLSFYLVIQWNDFQERQHTSPEVAQSTSSSSSSSATEAFDSVPEIENIKQKDLPQLANSAANQETINVKTDSLIVKISTRGGDIVGVELPKYFKKIDTPDDPFVLLENDSDRTYLAQSGLIGKNGTDTNTKPRPVFQSDKTNYVLSKNENSLNVDLHFTQANGVQIIKRFHFEKGSYDIHISYIINNTSDTVWRAALYGQIKRDSHNPVSAQGLGMQPFLGAATTTNEKNYDKFKFSSLADETEKHEKIGGWVAMVQHYFLSAWIPPQNQLNKYVLKKEAGKDLYILQFTSKEFSVDPGSQGEETFQFYAGPKDIKTLEKISPYLDLTVDYSFLWWIAKPLFYALDFIHGFVGNWGVAIILLTLCIKLLFFYPSAASYRSMAKMRKIQPKMAELKERYGDDRQKFSQEMMKMYRKEKVNPLGGCLPILIQMPVFLALYWVLMESVDLRQAPFIFWIKDLSVRDPYYILPAIMGATMFLQQRLQPTPPDPMQAKIMQMMPVFFTFLMLFFPAGLVLYWVVNNSLSITQQYVITKQIEKEN